MIACKDTQYEEEEDVHLTLDSPGEELVVKTVVRFKEFTVGILRDQKLPTLPLLKPLGNLELGRIEGNPRGERCRAWDLP